MLYPNYNRIMLALTAAGLVLATVCAAHPTTNSVTRSGTGQKPHTAHTPRVKPQKKVVFYGPPLPPERLHASEFGEELRRCQKTGQLRFANPERDGAQIFCVARDGVYFWPPETPQAVASNTFVPAAEPDRTYIELASRHSLNELFRTPDSLFREDPEKPVPPAEPIPEIPDTHLMQALCVLARHSVPSRPFEVLSLLRPPYRTAYWRHGGRGTLHAQGMAVDISAYDGYRIVQSDPESCVQMVLALLRDLPPGHYRFGMPKAPDTLLVVGQVLLPPSLTALAYPPFPVPRNQILLPSRHKKARPNPPMQATMLPPNFATLPAALGIAAGFQETAWPFFPAPEPEIRDGVIAPTRPNGTQPHILRFKNEAYAPAEALNDLRLKAALQKAAKRGVVMVGMFPDGADHIHLDVKQKP